MKTLSFFCMIVFGSFCFGQEAQTLSDCQKNASSQLQLNQCAGQELARADAEMNRIYQRLLAKVKNNTVAVRKIRSAQRAWLAFRNAHLEAVYPHADKQAEYGSAYAMCVAELKTDLTLQQTKTLSRLLNPVEGNVCRGSLR